MVQPVAVLEVIPYLPPELERLRELAYNLRWTWEHEVIDLFMQLDRYLWDSTNQNPVLLLGSIGQEKLNEAAADEGFVSNLERVYDRHRQYMGAEGTWYEKSYGKREAGSIAYFSAEFGLANCLPIYSGGLGVLAGDHIKSASDLGLPLVGVGIVYQQGYFRQYLNPDGWQQERYPTNDFYNLPIAPVNDRSGNRLKVSVDLPDGPVVIQIWHAQVGRVSLYLLDTNLPENPKPYEDITDQLYHGDKEMRIRQELVLGVGGMRALKALGFNPAVCHMNEGHSAFLALERIAMIMADMSLDFEAAREIATASQVFTTHTPVPAGIDRFTPEITDRYLADYYRRYGLTRERFLALGRVDADDDSEPFSMANLAMRLSCRVNAVSRLHGQVSRGLFGTLWPDVPEADVPIVHVTNGVHPRSWISQEMASLYDRYLGQRWSEDVGDISLWRRVADMPDAELWRVHEGRRESLVAFCRRRFLKQLEDQGALRHEFKEAQTILDPAALTIGFARRVATYKRATLILRDPDRLAGILANRQMPVQFIIAGKGHPEDTPAKELIRDLVHFSRRPEVKGSFVFIQDYDMNVARYLVQGVDLWLNTPRRFLEACGTSGMKVAFNGGINMSVLDGWWDEAYEAGAGWAIGHGEVYSDQDYQDHVESDALYDLLEGEVIPLFYERDEDGHPRAWIERMKVAMLAICPVFNVNRMIREYSAGAYFPAEELYSRLVADGGAKASQLSAWRRRLSEFWQDVSIEKVLVKAPDKAKVGDEMRVEARVRLGKLRPEEVSAEIYHGLIDSHGEIDDGLSVPMDFNGETKGAFTFQGVIRCLSSGRHGFTVRVMPHHSELDVPFASGLVKWARE